MRQVDEPPVTEVSMQPVYVRYVHYLTVIPGVESGGRCRGNRADRAAATSQQSLRHDTETDSRAQIVHVPSSPGHHNAIVITG